MEGIGPSMGAVTGEGVIRDFKRVRSQIGKKVEKSPGVISMSHSGDPQRPRKLGNTPWAVAFKKRTAETRDTKRPGLSARGADSRMYGHEASVST